MPAYAHAASLQSEMVDYSTLRRLRRVMRGLYRGHPVDVSMDESDVHVVFPEYFLFDFMHGYLHDQGVQAISAMATHLLRAPMTRVTVISARNMPDEGFETHITARRRAMSVKAALQSRGLHPGRVEIATLRESELHADPAQRSNPHERLHVILSPRHRFDA